MYDLERIDIAPVRRVAKACRNPKSVVSFVIPRTKAVIRSLISGPLPLRRFPTALFEEIVGIDIYLPYIKWQTGDEAAIFGNIHGYKMELFLNDKGLSRDLALYRTREEGTVKDYKPLLKKLGEKSSEPVSVLEIGANLGYYALMEKLYIGENSEMIAVEPSSKNISILESNLRLNKVQDEVELQRAAIGASEGSVDIEMSDNSNLHRVAGESSSNNSTRTEKVPLRSADNLIEDYGWKPSQVDVVRMDVEGYEGEVFKGMEEILTSDNELILMVELHCHLISRAELDRIVDRLEDSNFTIESSVESNTGVVGGEKSARLTELDELRGRSRGIRLILKQE